MKNLGAAGKMKKCKKEKEKREKHHNDIEHFDTFHLIWSKSEITIFFSGQMKDIIH